MYKKRNKEYWKNYRKNRRALAKAKKLIKANGDSFVGEDEPIRSHTQRIDTQRSIYTYDEVKMLVDFIINYMQK